MNIRLLFLLIIIFNSCEKKRVGDICEQLEQKFKTLSHKEDSKSDSVVFYIDELLKNCKPNNFALLNRKLDLLFLSENYEKTIPVYNKILENDSSKLPFYNFEFGRFYVMALSDSVKYKKQMDNYYQKVIKEDITDVLKNPDVYRDQPKIYERMKLSYYFEGKNKTLKTFEPISEKIPYKFYYNMIKNNKNPTEFLKFGMER